MKENTLVLYEDKKIQEVGIVFHLFDSSLYPYYSSCFNPTILIGVPIDKKSFKYFLILLGVSISPISLSCSGAYVAILLLSVV